MKYSVCLDAVYEGRDVLESIRCAKKSGIAAVEFWGWWDKDYRAIAAETQRQNLEISAFCTKFFPLTDPDAHKSYVEGLKESIVVARQLGCSTLITQTGPDTGASKKFQWKSLSDGLKACAPILQDQGITLVVEPLNTKVNHPGYFLSSAQEAFDLIDEVNSPFVRVLYDIYHQQITEGDILRTMLPNLDKIGHIHAAGNPGRNELTKGELNYPYIFSQLQKAGYNHYIGLEYTPLQNPEEGIREVLSWSL